MRLPRARRVSPPATSHRIPGTRTSARSRGRCADSRRGGLPRREPPRRGLRSTRNRPLRGPPGETPDPLARLFARQLTHRLPDHLLEAADPILHNVRDEGLEVVELLPRRRQLAPSLLVLHSGLLPVTLLLCPGRRDDIFLPAKLLEGGYADVDGIPERARLGPRLGHPDQVRGYRPVDVLRGSVACSAELALLGPDHGLHDRDLTVLLGRNLQKLGLDAPETSSVRLLQEPRVEHEPLALALDHVLFPHYFFFSSKKRHTISSLNSVRMWIKINIRRSARRCIGVRL